MTELQALAAASIVINVVLLGLMIRDGCALNYYKGVCDRLVDLVRHRDIIIAEFEAMIRDMRDEEKSSEQGE